MILFNENALKECIKDAVKEEMHTLLRDVKKAADTSPKLKTEKLLTKKEMAEELDISLVSLTEWMKKGRIPYMRMGKRIYFRKEEVLASMTNFNGNKGDRI